MSAFNFDATQVKPDSGGFVLVPKGTYTASICGSEIKENSAKNGRIMELNFKIIGGEFAGNVVKERLNIEHKGSPEAERIGLSQLSSICHAIQVLKLTMTDQLHGRPLSIFVDVEDYVGKNKTTGAEEPRQSNRITSYTKAEGTTAGAPASAPPSFLTQPTAPPVAQPAPVAPPVQPTPPPVAPVATLYYVSHKGQNITPTPISSTEVLAMGLPANEVMVCANGGTAWESVTVLTPAPPVQPAAGTPPPWARP